MTSTLAADTASVTAGRLGIGVSAGQVSSAAASMNSDESTGETEKPLVPNIGLFGCVIRAVSMDSPFYQLRGGRPGRTCQARTPGCDQTKAGRWQCSV